MPQTAALFARAHLHLSGNCVTRRPPPQPTPRRPWTRKRVLQSVTQTQRPRLSRARAAPIAVHTQAGSSQPAQLLGPITRPAQQYRGFITPEHARPRPIQARAGGGLAGDRVSWRAPQKQRCTRSRSASLAALCSLEQRLCYLAPFRTAGSGQVAPVCFPMVAAAQGHSCRPTAKLCRCRKSPRGSLDKHRCLCNRAHQATELHRVLTPS